MNMFKLYGIRPIGNIKPYSVIYIYMSQAFFKYLYNCIVYNYASLISYKFFRIGSSYLVRLNKISKLYLINSLHSRDTYDRLVVVR